jgi:hypothetical protein
MQLDDPPLVVRLHTTEATTSGARCERTIERRVSGLRRLTVPFGCYEARVRPRRLAACTVDYGFRASRLRWRKWNDAVAGSRGRWHPECAPVRGVTCPPPLSAGFALSRIRNCGATYSYTRLRVRPRGERSFVEPLGCPRPLVGGDLSPPRPA